MTDPAQPLPEGVDLREQVARIIDPPAFEEWGRRFAYRLEIDSAEAARNFAEEYDNGRCVGARAKADAILALPELRALRLPGDAPTRQPAP